MTHQSFFKFKRIVDNDLTRRFAKMPCAVGYVTHMRPVAGHHIKTRGAGGGDVEENLIPLCAAHHSEIHAMGIREFLASYWMRISQKNREKLEAHL